MNPDAAADTTAGLISRCPGCATTFRVNAAQLQLREGRVRCGRASMRSPSSDQGRYSMSGNTDTPEPVATRLRTASTDDVRISTLGSTWV